MPNRYEAHAAAEPLAEGVPPPSIPLRALREDEIEALRHQNCPMFTVTRTLEGLKVDCPYHPKQGD